MLKRVRSGSTDGPHMVTSVADGRKCPVYGNQGIERIRDHFAAFNSISGRPMDPCS